MESILNGTKQILGIEPGDDAFDHDIKTHINTAFSTLHQAGVSGDGVFTLTDINDVWGDLGLPDDQLQMVQSYVYVQVRILWDPPQTSFLIEARQEQLAEMLYRLNLMREEALDDAS